MATPPLQEAAVENLQQNQGTTGHHGEAMTLAKAAPKRRPLFQILNKGRKGLEP